MRNFLIQIWLALFVVVASSAAFAEVKPLTDDEKKAIWAAAESASINGPQDVPLADQAKIHLPENFIFIPKRQAAELMRMWGQLHRRCILWAGVPKIPIRILGNFD